MEYATQWPGSTAERAEKELDITFRSAREACADTMRRMYEAGYLTQKHVGRLTESD